MLILFRLGAKFVAIYGVKFGLEDLLRVKDLTFRNSEPKFPFSPSDHCNVQLIWCLRVENVAKLSLPASNG